MMNIKGKFTLEKAIGCGCFATLVFLVWSCLGVYILAGGRWILISLGRPLFAFFFFADSLLKPPVIPFKSSTLFSPEELYIAWGIFGALLGFSIFLYIFAKRFNMKEFRYYSLIPLVLFICIIRLCPQNEEEYISYRQTRAFQKALRDKLKSQLPYHKFYEEYVLYRIELKDKMPVAIIETTGASPDTKEETEKFLKEEAIEWVSENTGLDKDEVGRNMEFELKDEDPLWHKKNLNILSSRLPYTYKYREGVSWKFEIKEASEVKKLCISIDFSGSKEEGRYSTFKNLYGDAMKWLNKQILEGSKPPPLSYTIIYNDNIKNTDEEGFEFFAVKLFLDCNRIAWNKRINGSYYADSVNYFGKTLKREGVINKENSYWKKLPGDQEMEYEDIQIVKSNSDEITLRFVNVRRTDYSKPETEKKYGVEVKLLRSPENQVDFKISVYIMY